MLRDYFTLNRSVHSHSTRNCNSLHVSFVQSTFGKRSIKFKGPMLWNNLPAPLKEPMSNNKCRKLIKVYLTTDSESWIFSCVYAMLRYCIVLMFLWVHAKWSLLYSCVWIGEWWDGWYFTIFRFCFTIFRFCFYWFFCINVRVLTMLAASIDGFLEVWVIIGVSVFWDTV